MSIVKKASTSSKSVNPLQQDQADISKIDADILKLLIKRYERSAELQTKRRLPKNGISYAPDREALALRAVIEKNAGRLPVSSLVKIWREILSGESQLFRSYSIAVYTKENTGDMMELAKEYFGENAKYIPCLSISQAIQKIDSGDAGVAVLPLFEQSQESWWTTLGSGDHKDLKIVAKIPFLKNNARLSREGFIISNVDIRPTGHDHSLYAIEMTSQTSIGSLKSILEDVGLTVNQVWPAHLLSRVYLFAVEFEGVISQNDKRILNLLQKQEKNIQLLRPIGGYAISEVL